MGERPKVYLNGCVLGQPLSEGAKEINVVQKPRDLMFPSAGRREQRLESLPSAWCHSTVDGQVRWEPQGGKETITP